MPDRQSDFIKIEFIKYLDLRGISSKSNKNYKSDLSHFTSWAILKIRSFGSYVESLTEIIPFLSSDLGIEYKNYMIENTMPVKTVNRRLSTLRNLAKFLLETKSLDFDFTQGLKNMGSTTSAPVKVNPIFDDFKLYLVSEKVSPNTIKNYLSDIKHFLFWLEENQKVVNSKL